MRAEYVLLATFTYPHEAIFIESALASKGLKFQVKQHKPLIKNDYYAFQEQVKNIYVKGEDICKALCILNSIKPDNHTKNRCTLLHTNEIAVSTKPSRSEKGFCWSCYALMFSSLGFVVYSIINSLQCMF